MQIGNTGDLKQENGYRVNKYKKENVSNVQ